MNLIEMEGFLRGKCIPGDMLVNESNAEYLVRKFQEISAQRDALAAENAGLKDYLKPLGLRIEGVPATDSFLAELRAQGVEKLATLAGNEHQRYKSVGDRAGTRKWKSIVILCTDFAAQLRQGELK